MKQKRYVQHRSGQGPLWEIKSEERDGWVVYGPTGGRFFLPKYEHEYRLIQQATHRTRKKDSRTA